MAVLRKALGEDKHVIKTIPGRGYLIADDCEQIFTDTIQAYEPSDGCAGFVQSKFDNRTLDLEHDIAQPKASADLSENTTPPTSAEPNGRKDGPEPSSWEGVKPGHSSPIDEIGTVDFNQRLTELEQENAWLKLAIASLTLKRLEQILPRGALGEL